MSLATSDLFGDRGADVSACGRFRYSLWRRWSDAPAVLFVMLNPSTADASRDDPTIRRCVGFARRWGAGGISVCNLYAWRASKPAVLIAAARRGDPIVGEDLGAAQLNDVAISAAASAATRVVVAWGAWPGPVVGRSARVMDLLAGRRVEALALTKAGQPRHPLFVSSEIEPVPYGPFEGPTGAEGRREGLSGA